MSHHAWQELYCFGYYVYRCEFLCQENQGGIIKYLSQSGGRGALGPERIQTHYSEEMSKFPLKFWKYSCLLLRFLKLNLPNSWGNAKSHSPLHGSSGSTPMRGVTFQDLLTLQSGTAGQAAGSLLPLSLLQLLLSHSLSS